MIIKISLEEPDKETYRLAEIMLMRLYSPRVYQCSCCKWPVLEDHKCNFCRTQHTLDKAAKP